MIFNRVEVGSSVVILVSCHWVPDVGCGQVVLKCGSKSPKRSRS
jgi:hypothetical protein